MLEEVWRVLRPEGLLIVVSHSGKRLQLLKSHGTWQCLEIRKCRLSPQAGLGGLQVGALGAWDWGGFATRFAILRQPSSICCAANCLLVRPWKMPCNNPSCCKKQLRRRNRHWGRAMKSFEAVEIAGMPGFQWLFVGWGGWPFLTPSGSSKRGDQCDSMVSKLEEHLDCGMLWRGFHGFALSHGFPMFSYQNLAWDIRDIDSTSWSSAGSRHRQDISRRRKRSREWIYQGMCQDKVPQLLVSFCRLF